MRAVRLHAIGDLRVEEIAPPLPPKPGEVSLHIAAAAICGSDLHNFKTGAWISRLPSVAGHEFTGMVSAVGEGVTHVSPGQRVIVDSRWTCGECPACRAGKGQVCDRLGYLGEVIDGGFAEAVTIPARNVIAAPEHVPDRHLAMAEPLAVALHTLRRLNPKPGEAVVITGCGAVGGLVALLASRAGHPVKLIDRNENRTALVAQATGAEIITLDALAALRLNYAVESTGSHAVLAALVNAIAGCGSIAVVGIGNAAPVIDPVKLVERELSLFGCHAFTTQDMQDIHAMLPELSRVLDAFIAEQIPLSAVPESYARHLAGAVDGLKSIILCGEG
jgi:(R,R)-butanediol dehydrogenase/meso-butanediol dehydrogenase/diacetyl reductase